MTTQRLTPKHQTVLDALSAVTSGMYLGSIKGRIGPKISGDELDDILRDLVRVGLMRRLGERKPVMFKRVWGTDKSRSGEKPA